MRKSKFSRETKETEIEVRVNLDGEGEPDVDTGIPFFDHMLESLSKHSGIDLELFAEGDIEVDYHHTIEDTGIVLGKSLKEAVDKEKIKRFGFASIPMDEALSKTSIDFGDRNYLVSDLPNEKVSGIEFRVFRHFFKSLVDNAEITLHIEAIGDDPHHIMETVFKSFAVALKRAIKERDGGPRSTKGTL